MPGYLISPLSSGASSIPFSPSGNIVAHSVQGAIEELDSEKASFSDVSASVSSVNSNIIDVEGVALRGIL